MQVIINGTISDVPFDLNEISLSKYVEYYEAYGRTLDQQLSEIHAKVYEGDDDDQEEQQSAAIDLHVDNEALAWYSFWTGFDFQAAKDQKFIEPVLQQYRLMRYLIRQGIEEAQFLPVLNEWMDEQWTIQSFIINPASEMSANEIFTSKEVMRMFYKLGKGKWDAMPYLCAIFFRKKGEPFTDELIQDGSPRMELMQILPLSYALQVAFFLSICVSIYNSTSQSLAEREAVEKASLH